MKANLTFKEVIEKNGKKLGEIKGDFGGISIEFEISMDLVEYEIVKAEKNKKQMLKVLKTKGLANNSINSVEDLDLNGIFDNLSEEELNELLGNIEANVLEEKYKNLFDYEEIKNYFSKTTSKNLVQTRFEAFLSYVDKLVVDEIERGKIPS